MQRYFNTECACNPDRDYMVDITEKFLKTRRLIDNAKYFCINRARQFGKTTFLNYVINQLNNQYHFVYINYDEFSENDTASFDNFKTKFCSYLSGLNLDVQKGDLYTVIRHYCSNSSKPIVLVIDNIEDNFKNEPFVHFLCCTRATYQERERGRNFAFHSVILSGSYWVVNLCHEFEPDKHYSPWNVAAQFNVDMSFSPKEISSMLTEYVTDHQIGMDIVAVSEEIYKFTFGHPFLVSKICKIIDEEIGGLFSVENICNAITLLTSRENITIFNNIVNNLRDNKDLYDLLHRILLTDFSISFAPFNPVIELANRLGIIKEDENYKIQVHNLVFETVIYNYLISGQALGGFDSCEMRDSQYYIQNGNLNMVNIIRRFSDLMHEEYRDRDQKFIEQQGRLLFLCYLKPIINGTGFYYVEPQTRENARMDLVVTYNKKEYIIELKIWHGTQYETEGKIQLAEYLATRNASEGYLVTFSFLKNKTFEEPSWKEIDGKRIYEAVI